MSPVTGLLAMDGVGHLHGWQWLFLVEGVLTVLMGIYLAMALASGPSKVSNLNHCPLAPSLLSPRFGLLLKRDNESVPHFVRINSGC